MKEKRPSSYAKTKRDVRQRQRYQKQMLFLCIAILVFAVMAIRCLARLCIIEIEEIVNISGLSPEEINQLKAERNT